MTESTKRLVVALTGIPIVAICLWIDGLLRYVPPPRIEPPGISCGSDVICEDGNGEFYFLEQVEVMGFRHE